MALHSNLTAGDLHSVCNYIYADATTRLAATGFLSGDVGKFAFQQDTSSIWLLTGYSPITWREINTGGASELYLHAEAHSLSGTDEITIENLSTDGQVGTVLTSDGAGGLLMAPKYGARVLEVGADQTYTSISAALTAAAVLDPVPSAAAPVLILVSPGVYAENNIAGPIQLVDYVTVQGIPQHNGVIVTGYVDTNYLFQSSTNGYGFLSNMIITGMDGVGGGGVLVNSGQTTTLMNVNFTGNTIGLRVTGSGVVCFAYTLIFMGNGIGARVDTSSSFIVTSVFATSCIGYGFVIDAASFEATNIKAYGTGGSSVGFSIDNSADVELNNGKIDTFGTGVYIGEGGGTFRMNLIRFLNSVTYDINFLGDATWKAKACEFTYSKIHIDEAATVARIVLDHPSKVLVVAKDGGDFTSVKEANDSITDSSSTNPYVIKVEPGIYSEDPFTIKTYVSVIGQGGPFWSVDLQTTDQNNHFITLGIGSLLENVAVTGPSGTGYAAINYSSGSYVPAELFRVLIKKGYYGVYCHPATYGKIHLFYCAVTYIGTNMNKYIYTTDYGKTSCFTCSAAGPPTGTVATCFEVVGANAYLSLDDCLVGVSNSTAVMCDNGALVRLNACSITLGTYGLRIGSTGTGSTITATGCSILPAVTNGIYTDTNTGIIQFSGSADKNKITVSSGTNFSASFTDATSGEEGHVIFGELWLGNSSIGSVPLGSYTRAIGSSGLASGGGLVKTTGRGITVGAGIGYISDGSIVEVTWEETALTLTASKPKIWIQVSEAGTVSEVFTQPDDEAVIVLGVAATDASNVTFLADRFPKLSQSTISRHIYSRDVVGPISVSGCTVTKHDTTSVEVDVDSGSYYIFDNQKTTTSASPATFNYWYRDGSGGWTVVTGQTSIDDEHYDDSSGTLANIPLLNYKGDLLYVANDGDSTTFHCIYAQETHLLSASVVDNPVPPDILTNNALRLARIVIQDGSNNITSISDQRPKLGQLASGSTSITNHGDLSGLGDDDHTIYQLRSEENAANGYCGLNASSQVAAAQLPITSTSPVNVTKASAVVGTSTELARQDHKHDIDTATAVDITTASAEGNSTSLARANHTHAGLTRGASDFNGFTAKTTVVGADLLLIEDSEANPVYTKKKILLSYLPKRWPYSNVLTVDKTDTDADYSTIQAAITAASAGTTILVSPGDYSEALTLKDGVDIIGLSPHGVGARGGYGTTNTGVNIKTLSSAVPITLSTGSASIQGCGIYQERAGQTATFKTVVMSGTKLLLKDCRIEQVGSAWPDGSTFYTIEQTAGELNLVNCEIISPPEYSTIPIYGLYIHGASTTCNAYNCKFSPNISTTYQCNIYINNATAVVNLNGCLVQGDCVKTLGTLNLYGGNQLDNGVTTEWGWPDPLDGTYATFKTWDSLRRDGSLPVYKLPCALTTGDIGSPNNGDIWYNNSTGKFRVRENGATSDMISSSNIVFGQDFDNEAADSRTTTTSNSYQTKLTLTTAALTGTYRVGWSCVTDLGTTGNLIYARLYNNTDSIAYEEIIKRCYATTEKNHCGGIEYITFSGAAKTFYLQWRAGTNGNTAGCAFARIELWRVS